MEKRDDIQKLKEYDFTDLKEISSMIKEYLTGYIDNPTNNYYGQINCIKKDNYEITVAIRNDKLSGAIRIDVCKKINKNYKVLMYIGYQLVKLQLEEDSYFKLNDKKYKFIDEDVNRNLFKEEYSIIVDMRCYINKAVLILLKTIGIDEILSVY